MADAAAADDTLIPSRSEIAALVAKAARGTGMTFGMAEETAFAARQLESWGVPALESVADHLETLDAGTGEHQPLLPLIQRSGDVTATSRGDAALTFAPDASGEAPRAEGPFCPITLGIRLVDAADTIQSAPLTLPPMLSPLLIIPFLGLAAGPSGAIALQGAHGVTLCAADAVAGPLPDAQRADGPLSVVRIDTRLAATPFATPRPVPASVWQTLNRFAARTYVPATAASRDKGAGAAASDND